ncbi:hypothetical protein TL16_g03130 [Triparma laevis f. inornata]|uniref:Uncharacterized protein n=1 Tax=Triparma laevis f. inornata TaxID=1714386 RepID=A0A9W6ZYL7_9STRA|nr:hypothetical protein TL16_g03130 [Triparma laevis f. inornata]
MSSTIVPAGIQTMTTSIRKGPVLHIHPESLRLSGYLAFWFMVAVSIIVTKAKVTEDLENTLLIEWFGYNNICVYFDFNPAREVAAMIYPLVEYCLFLYLLASHLHVWCSWRQKLVSRRFLLIDRVLVIIETILMSWFRMVFVIKAPDDIKGHTYGFLGLQVVLCIVAIKNLVYFHKIHMSPLQIMQQQLGFPNLLNEKGQDIVGGTYVVLLVGVTVFKMAFCLTTFAGNPFIDTKTKGSSGQKIAQLADVIWMLLAAVVPAIIAFFQRKHTDTLHIGLGFDESKVLGTKDENASLLTSVETGTVEGEEEGGN